MEALTVGVDVENLVNPAKDIHSALDGTWFAVKIASGRRWKIMAKQGKTFISEKMVAGEGRDLKGKVDGKRHMVMFLGRVMKMLFKN